MLFSSITFIYIFLPLVCLTYFLVPVRFKNHILLFFSIVFYAWGEPKYFILMLITIFINYLGAVFIDRYRQYDKYLLFFTICFDISLLFYFKYFNFFIDNINNIFSLNIKFIDIVMPIGISFYTFQVISYLIDVYRKEVAVQENIYKLALYISFFPQLVAGPIVKYHDIEKSIDNRIISFNNISLGIKRFIIGLFKKVVIANTMGTIADKIFIQDVTYFDSLTAWVGAIAYTFQIYYDFSGYSDMAIGLGMMFGFKFKENFNYPYISRSITEFWHRWHISLSTWFKEYLYIPLGGNRVSNFRTYLNLFIVFLVTGFWHGANFTFIVWGIYHGFFVIFEKITNFNMERENAILKILQHIYTIFVIVIGWVIFKSKDIFYSIDYIKNMFGFIRYQQVGFDFQYYMGNREIVVFIVACLFSMPIWKYFFEFKKENFIFCLSRNLLMLFLFFLSTISLATSTYNPFIYFRF